MLNWRGDTAALKLPARERTLSVVSYAASLHMPLKDLLRRRPALPRTLAPELDAERSSRVPWMYEWQLTPDVAIDPGRELARVHATRLAMIEPVVRRALAQAGRNASVLDLGCNEGWFGHRALEWGAGRVVGIDVRPANLRRATLIRDHFGIPADRLRFEEAGVHELDPKRLGTFDVVLILGLIYHLEDPIGALRVARALTDGVVVVESQLTSSNNAMLVGWGKAGVFKEVDTHWAAVLEPAAEQREDGNPLASHGGVISLVPNRAALLQAIEVVGYREPRILDAGAHLDPQYVEGHRGIAFART
jgi:tRNA (mo5U34)-methyltransferase